LLAPLYPEKKKIPREKKAKNEDKPRVASESPSESQANKISAPKAKKTGASALKARP
jgi:hypothetical protein